MATHPTSAVADHQLVSRPPAGEHKLIPATVTANEQIGEHVRRLTLTAPEFHELQLSGPDEYFGLLMPPNGRPFRPFPASPGNIRSIVADIDEESRPELRWYTVRNLDQATGSVDVDIVMHGDTGPGSRWVQRTGIGETAGIYTCSGIWSRPAADRLLVADATAAPALRSILEFLADHHPTELATTHAVVIAPSENDLEPALEQEWANRLATLHIRYAPVQDQATEIGDLIGSWTDQGHPGATVEYVWACGESALAKTVRTVAVQKWGIDPSRVGWATYWIQGRPRP